MNLQISTIGVKLWAPQNHVTDLEMGQSAKKDTSVKIWWKKDDCKKENYLVTHFHKTHSKCEASLKEAWCFN